MNKETKTNTFKNKVVLKSLANNWDDAKLEWTVVEVFHPDCNTIEDARCLCGKKNLKTVYTLKNKETRETINVGSECVKLFENDNLVKATHIASDTLNFLEHGISYGVIDYALLTINAIKGLYGLKFFNRYYYTVLYKFISAGRKLIYLDYEERGDLTALLKQLPSMINNFLNGEFKDNNYKLKF